MSAFNPIASAIQQIMPAAVATGLFTSLCTIQRPDGLTKGAGQPSGVYVTVLADIACMKAVPGFSAIVAKESKTIAEVQATGLWHVLLSGYYPEASPDGQIPTDWRALVDGVYYDVLGVDHDSQNVMTRLELQIVEI